MVEGFRGGRSSLNIKDPLGCKQSAQLDRVNRSDLVHSDLPT